MDSAPEPTPASAALPHRPGSEQAVTDLLKADQISVTQGGVGKAYANQLTVHQGGVNSVEAESVGIVQGGVAVARTGSLTVEQGGVGLAFAAQARLDRSEAGVIVAERAEVTHGRALVLLAREVHGSVETVLDTRGAALAGIAAGVVVGLVLLIGGQLGRRRD